MWQELRGVRVNLQLFLTATPPVCVGLLSSFLLNNNNKDLTNTIHTIHSVPARLPHVGEEAVTETEFGPMISLSIQKKTGRAGGLRNLGS